MNIEKLKNLFREGLLEDYKSRNVEGVKCAICGSGDRKYGMHIIQYAQDATKPLPKGFVPMSSSYGTIRGCFPICDKCSPPCKQCGLPIVTNKVKEYYQSLTSNKNYPDSVIYMGNGVCQHLQSFVVIGDFLKKYWALMVILIMYLIVAGTMYYSHLLNKEIDNEIKIRKNMRNPII